jgi:amino acid adenylation domain-containing protein
MMQGPSRMVSERIVSRVLDSALARQVDEIPFSSGTMAGNVWLALSATLIYRYTDRDDVTVGSAQQLTTLDLSSDPSFANLLKMVSVLPPIRDPHLRLVLQNANTAHLLPRLRHTHDDETCASITLGVHVAEEICCSIEYSPDWIDDDAAVTLLQHLNNIAAQVSVAPETRLSQIPMLDSQELAHLSRLTSGPRSGYPGDPVHVMFERVASSTPHAIALRHGNQEVSFEMLNATANRIAGGLRRAYPIGPESIVGLCAQRSPHSVAAILGILKAGGAYLPLDPSYPRERLIEIIADARPTVVVGTKDTLPALPETVPSFDAEDDSNDAHYYPNPPNESSLDDLAYLMYTSGSTGRPKGVALTHRSILNGLNHPPFERGDLTEVSPLNTSFSLGITTARLFLPLLSGLPLVILPVGVERDLTLLVRAWEEAQVTNLAMVTPQLRELLALGPSFTSRLHRVRRVVVGGDMMTSELVQAFHAAFPNAALNHGYAATELGGAGIVHDRLLESGPVYASVGTPFPNTRIYIVDRWLNLLPVGAVGEICFSAPHLARCYVNQPALTADRFVPDPFGDRGNRLYRSGDMGRLLPNGEYQLLGRVDDQVKIRGFRVDLSDVEAALAEHPAIALAAVAAREIDGGRQLIAYLVRIQATNLTVTALRDFVTQRLPDFMVPSRFEFVDALPRTPNGKVDRRALPIPLTTRPPLDHTYEPPRSEVESEMVALWTTLLGIDSIGIHDHFLEVGGDSFFATRVALHIIERFGLELNETLVFERPTIASLSEYIERELSNSD